MSLWTFSFCTSLAGLAVLLAYGIVTADLFGQEIWSSEGLQKPCVVVKYAAMAGGAHLQTAEKSKAKSQQSIAKLNSRVAYSPPGMAACAAKMAGIGSQKSAACEWKRFETLPSESMHSRSEKDATDGCWLASAGRTRRLQFPPEPLR